MKNPEAKKQLKDVYGIGTEATRATIIEDLVKRKFMQKQGKKKYLVPTPAAYLLVDALPDEMTYPDSTAIWEDKLHSMSEGDGTLAEFLTGQIEFTKKLCAKAGNAQMEVTGDNVCPRCHSGVLTQRKGKNGLFWGCSNYPKCRMTCNDKDGQPDLEDAKARMARSFRSTTPAAVSASQLARQSGGAARTAPRPAPTMAYAQTGAGPSAQDMADLNSLFAAADYEAQMAADMASYEASRPAPRQWQNWGDKPKYSASPLEKAAKENKAADDKYLCPKCREGHLRLIRGKNGSFWGCTNYPRCTATFDDSKGMPRLDS